MKLTPGFESRLNNMLESFTELLNHLVNFGEFMMDASEKLASGEECLLKTCSWPMRIAPRTHLYQPSDLDCKRTFLRLKATGNEPVTFRKINQASHCATISMTNATKINVRCSIEENGQRRERGVFKSQRQKKSSPEKERRKKFQWIRCDEEFSREVSFGLKGTKSSFVEGLLRNLMSKWCFWAQIKLAFNLSF